MNIAQEFSAASRAWRVAAAASGLASLCACTSSPGIDPASLEVTSTPPAQCDGLSVTWMGVTTLLIDDGETRLISDGYFTRVSALALAGDIEPDQDIVAGALADLGVQDAAAVMVVHSHFDHALDAPVVAGLTGATLLGSESTANVGRGLSLPESQIHVVTPGETMPLGDFGVTFIESRHWPLPEPWASQILGNSIDVPLVPPASALDYKEGVTWSIVIEHPAATLVLQGSAGYIPGALAQVQADAVLLGTGGLGDLPPDEQLAYFEEVVLATGAEAVYPIHWEVMTTPLGEPFEPESDFERAMQFLEARKQATGVDYGLLPKGEPVCISGAGDA